MSRQRVPFQGLDQPQRIAWWQVLLGGLAYAGATFGFLWLAALAVVACGGTP
ncbi:MAG: hypothetical protein ACOYOH_29075 [Paracraurococcus sp.]